MIWNFRGQTRIGTLLVVALVPLRLPGQPKPGQNPNALTKIAEGRAVFTKACSFCHGADATGGSEGPNLTLSSTVRHDVDGDLIGVVIREGRPSRGMPSIALQPGQVTAVVSYLHARVAELDRRSAGKPPLSYGLENLLTGNVEKGKAFFQGAGRCQTCHSATGDLAGIAAKYPPVELQARFLYPQDRPEMVEVSTRDGKRVEGTLVLEDAFTISLRDRDGWYHSWALDSVQVKRANKLEAHRELLDRYTQADMHNVFAYLETLK